MKRVDADGTDRIRALEMEEMGEVFQEQLPATTEEVIERFGDRTVEYQRGESERLASVLRTSGLERYDSIDELQLAILNGVSRDAVGRPRYSDRSDEHEQSLQRMQRSF